MPATKNALNVLIGSATLYIADLNATNPDDDVELDGDWGADWHHPGYSEEGLSLELERKEKKHMVNESTTPVRITVEETSFKVVFGFAEATLKNLSIAAGGDITSQDAATGVIGKDTLVLSDDLTERKLGFEGKNPQGFFRRVIIPRVVAIGTMETSWDHSQNIQIYKAEFEAVGALSDILISDKTDEATA